jgi:hypothetical protein
MKKPKDWYGFKVSCKLYDFGQSNMTPSSQQQYCLRKDRQGKDRKRWKNPLKCHWNVCPKLKELRQKAKSGQIQTCPPTKFFH